MIVLVVAIGGFIVYKNAGKFFRAGGAAGVLPDQQPSRGQGRFAPFFGNPALTGVLAPRLAQRTNCQVLASVCERLAGGRYRVHFLPVDQAIHSDDLTTSLTAVNRSVEDAPADTAPAAGETAEADG